MRVGLYGGSFNPVHAGHRHVATTALQRLGLDRLIWLVSPGNPLKAGADLAAMAERMAWTRRCAKGPRMIVSDIERRLGLRYTVDTVQALKRRFPGVHFVWIMGADSLGGFHLWRDWQTLMRTTPVAVVARPGLAAESRFSPAARRFAFARRRPAFAPRLAGARAPAWVFLNAPLDYTSSTRLRQVSRARGELERSDGN